MSPYAMAAGLILIALGLWGYLGAAIEARSLTALIPAFVGLPLLLLGLLALKEHYRKHAMHAAAALALLGAIAALVGLIMGYQRTGELTGRGAITSGGMLLVCVVFVVLCVRSFIAARRAQAARQDTSSPPASPTGG